MDFGFDQRSAVISGGSRGIGRAVARALVQAGANVAIAGRTETNVATTVGELQELAQEARTRSKVVGIAVDLSRAAGVQRFADEAIAGLGGVDILVNNVGDSGYGNLRELADETIVDAWMLKTMGAIRLTRALLPNMEARGWGSIVNISGGAGRSPSPDGIPAALANSGVRIFTKAMAGDLARKGIAINCITPDLVNTDRHLARAQQQSRAKGISVEQVLQEQDAATPTGHVTRPEEIAELVLFLASRRVYNLTGAEIVLDAGRSRFL